MEKKEMNIDLNLLNNDNDEKYIKCFEQANPQNNEEIFEVLGVMNSFLIVKSMDKDFEEKNKLSLTAFYRWFMRIYGEDEKLMEEMSENWFGRLPRVLAMGQTFHEELELNLALKNYYDLDDKERGQVDIFMNTMTRLNGDKDFTFYYADGTSFWVRLVQDISKDEKEYLFFLARGYVAKALDQKGILIFALNPQTKRERISAFDFDGRKIKPIPKQIVKEIAQGETSINTKTTVFEEIDVFKEQKQFN